VIGNIILFRAGLTLLATSKKSPKFMITSSAAGSINGQDQQPVPNAVYGTSKAAVNWVAKKVHLENEHLVAFPVHPG
jgi:norsolorinic acid ketoreductase